MSAESALAELKRIVQEERYHAPGAFTVRLPLWMIGLSADELENVVSSYKKEEHKIEEFDGEYITLVLA